MKNLSYILTATLVIGSISTPYCVSDAVATPVPTTVPFTQTLVIDHNPDTDTSLSYFNITKGQSIQANPAASTSSMTNTGTWGTTDGFASANLATGQLKARGAASFDGSGDTVYQQINAYFGDGFRTFDQSGPFTWQGNSTARFDLTVDGSYTSTPSVDVLGEGAFVLMSLYQPGFLPNPDGNIGGSAGLIANYLYLIGNPTQVLYTCSTTGNCTQLVPSAYVGDLSSPVHIIQDFQPGGDFDWIILLGMSGQLTVPGSWDFNLADTLTVNYNGPTGTTTQSVSGQFDNIDTTAVPEPGTLLLSVVGLAGVVRRRRASRA